MEEPDDEPEIPGFNELIGPGLDNGASQKYDKLRDAAELGKISAMRTETVVQMIQKDNEFALFKIQSQNEMEYLRRDYNEAIKERDRLKKELEESDKENEELYDKTADLEEQKEKQEEEKK